MAIYPSHPVLFENHVWKIVACNEGHLEVFASEHYWPAPGEDTGRHHQACDAVAAQAAAGNPDAVWAVLVCEDDPVLQEAVKKQSRKGE